MLSPDWIWAAGLFEGEGCISAGTQKTWAYARLSLTMTDEDVVRRFHEVVGVGTVVGPLPAKPGHKPTFRWHVGSRAGVAHVLLRFAPWLGQRRLAKGREVMLLRPIESWLPGYTRRPRTHCGRGHEMTDANTATGGVCVTCRRERRRRWTKTPKGRAWRARTRSGGSSAAT